MADVAISGATARGEVVVVGVDGSPASVEALQWALALARARRWGVEIVTAWPEAGAVLVHQVPGHCCAPRERAVSAQALAVGAAVRDDPEAPRLVSRLVNAHPVEALLAHAAGAQMLVVGSRRRNRDDISSSVRPSVGTTVAHLAPCPVVVVGEEIRAAPPLEPA